MCSPLLGPLELSGSPLGSLGASWAGSGLPWGLCVVRLHDPGGPGGAWRVPIGFVNSVILNVFKMTVLASAFGLVLSAFGCHLGSLGCLWGPPSGSWWGLVGRGWLLKIQVMVDS